MFLTVCFFGTHLASLSHVLRTRTTEVLSFPIILSSLFVTGQWVIYANLIKLWKMTALLYFQYVIDETGEPEKNIPQKHYPPGLGYVWINSVNIIKSCCFFIPDGSRIRASTIYPRPGG